MPLPSFVTQENIRFNNTLTNCLILSDDGITKEVIQWDRLSPLDKNRFDFLIDRLGGVIPLTGGTGSSRTIDMGGSVVGINPTGLDISVTANATLTIGGAAANDGITYTAVDSGVVGNSIRVAHVDPATVSSLLSVSVASNDITVSLATDGTGLIISTPADIEALILADGFANQLVLAAKEGDGLGIAVTGTLTNLSGGSTATVYSVDISIDGVVNNVSFEGNQAETFDDLIIVIATQVTGEAVNIDFRGDIRVSSLLVGELSTVTITNDQLFSNLTGFVAIEPMVSGATSVIGAMGNTLMDNGIDYLTVYEGLIEIIKSKPLRDEKYTELKIYFDGTDWRRKDTDAIVAI